MSLLHVNHWVRPQNVSSKKTYNKNLANIVCLIHTISYRPELFFLTARALCTWTIKKGKTRVRNLYGTDLAFA